MIIGIKAFYTKCLIRLIEYYFYMFVLLYNGCIRMIPAGFTDGLKV